MRTIATALAALTLSACGECNPNATYISPLEWTCDEWADVTVTHLQMAGRAAIPHKKTEMQCVEWRRVVFDVE